MLKEVPSESISCIRLGKVASGDPRPSLEEVVLIIERWHGEVIVDWVDLESLQGVHGGPRPLPDVAHRVKDTSHLVLIYGRRGR
jgi:hypothetical protein